MLRRGTNIKDPINFLRHRDLSFLRRHHSIQSQINKSVADPGEVAGRPGPPLIFRPNWGPKGQKNFFTTDLPLISRSGWPGFPFSEGLELPETLIHSASLGLKRDYFQHNLYLLVLASNSRSESKLPSSISFTRRCQFFSSSRKPLYVYTAKYENIVPIDVTIL